MAMLPSMDWCRTSTRNLPALIAKPGRCAQSHCVLRSSAKTSWSGEKKLEMVTLKVHTEAFKKLVGQKVRIPVGAFVAKGAIMFYALRNEAQPISAS